MKYIKTYGIDGLLEWYGTVSFGTMSMKVAFTNGSVTAYGVSPASFTTTDKLTQFVIENSEDFKNHRIRIVRSAVIEAEEPVVEEVRQASIAEPAEVVEAPVEKAAEVKIVEVADHTEAIEYLKENFSKEYTATKLRTKTAFEAACAECGVQFIFNE